MFHHKFDPKVCFISYRSDHYQSALKVKALLETKIKECILIPPAQLALPNEIRTPLGYFELVSILEPSISRADAFVLLNTPYYRESWWTRLEVDIWTLKSPSLALFNINSDGNPFFERMHYEGRMVLFERWFFKYRLWVAKNPNWYNLLGSLANSALMAVCPSCGKNLLVTKAYTNRYSATGIVCPACSARVGITVVSDRYTLDGGTSGFKPADGDTLIALLRGGSSHFLESLPNGGEQIVIKYHGQKLPLLRLPNEDVGG